jgi:hypothetical protein
MPVMPMLKITLSQASSPCSTLVDTFVPFLGWMISA